MAQSMWINSYPMVLCSPPTRSVDVFVGICIIYIDTGLPSLGASDVHIDLSWFTIHLVYTKIHVDSIQLIYDELQKGIQLTIHKSGEQHRRFNSPMISYTRFNLIQFNKKQGSTHLECVQLNQVLLVISYVTLPKSRTFLIYDNTGTQTWEYSESEFSECYTYSRHRKTKRACYSFIMSTLEFPCAPLWLTKMDCNREMKSSFGFFPVNYGFGFTLDHYNWVETQLRFIITAFHKAQLNSNSFRPAEPVDSTQVRFTAKLVSIHLSSYWIQFNSRIWFQLPITVGGPNFGAKAVSGASLLTTPKFWRTKFVCLELSPQ